MDHSVFIYRLMIRMSLYVTIGILFLMMGCQGAVPVDTQAEEPKETARVLSVLEPLENQENRPQTDDRKPLENVSAFHDHGIAFPVSALRGAVAVKDFGKGPGVLAWLQDHSGCSSLLTINTRTGASSQIQVPVDSAGDAPFASLLSRGNRFYTYYNSHFLEFDAATGTFTFSKKAAPGTAMSFTEDDKGLIWAATYPGCSLISFNPETRVLKDHGPIHKEVWDQYPYYMATDDSGWVYVALGYAGSQMVAFNPVTGKSRTVLAESERQPGMAYLYRDENGKVYGRALEDPKAGTYGRKPVAGSDGWYELYQGQPRNMGVLAQPKPRHIVAGRRECYQRDLGEGLTVKDLDFQNRVLILGNTSGAYVSTLQFSYKTEGATVLNVVTAPGGRIAGATLFPHGAFMFSPVSGSYIQHISPYQWNTLARSGSRFYIGAYPQGVLMNWEPGAEWTLYALFTGPGVLRHCASANPSIHRPHDLIVIQNGRTVILAGTPDYGMTGGGLFFWNTAANTSEQLDDSGVMAHLSVRSLALLKDGSLLGGTTSSAGTGGVKIADEASLFIMDIEEKKVLWSGAPLPGVQDYSDLAVAANGLVYGLADRSTFFVFDPVTRSIVMKDDSDRFGKVTWQQSQRAFVMADNGRCYLLFTQGIATVDAEKGIQWIETSPVPITAGGDILNGHIYFASGPRLYSYRISENH